MTIDVVSRRVDLISTCALCSFKFQPRGSLKELLRIILHTYKMHDIDNYLFNSFMQAQARAFHSLLLLQHEPVLRMSE